LQITQQRALHELPQLKAHGHVFREKGIPPFLSAEAYTLAWFDYQSMLIEKLNQLTFGTALDPVHTVHCTANKILILRHRR
jgi:superoxide dismutase